MSQLPVSENVLSVAEWFYSIQGEGQTAGVPAVFLRLKSCNLCCGGFHNLDVQQQEDMSPSREASWVCDTIATWRDGTEHTFDEIIEEFASAGVLTKLRDGSAHLVVTGGEPLLHQSKLVDFLREVNAWFVEVETNGTIVPNEDLPVSRFNVSPKLSNSGMSEEKRINPEALRWHAGHQPKSIFKFVVGNARDVDEVMDLQQQYDIQSKFLYLMPAGSSQAELESTAQMTAELCKTHGFRYSPRLHVDIWDQAVGV